jgi:hypothetical protein
MPALFTTYHLGQHVKRLWIRHILCIRTLALRMHLESSFLYLIMIFHNLQNSSSNIASDNCSLLVIADYVMFM